MRSVFAAKSATIDSLLKTLRASTLGQIALFVMAFAFFVPNMHAQQRAGDDRCRDGRYVGHPEKAGARYYKNRYVWAVTPEFAQRFCMPAEFVVNDLKGAEAIAYRHGKPTGQEVCETKEGEEICVPERYGHWLEIYVKTGAVAKYDPQVEFYVDQYLTSGELVETQQAVKNAIARNRGTYTDPSGRRRPYSGLGNATQGKRVVFNYLARVTSNSAEVRAAAMREHYYRQSWYEGIDLVALEGWSNGSIAGKDFPVDPAFGYAIGIHREADETAHKNYPAGYLHVIELPQRLTKVINAADRQGEKAFQEAVRRLGETFKPSVR